MLTTAKALFINENSCVLKIAKALNGVNSVIKNLDYKLYIRWPCRQNYSFYDLKYDEHCRFSDLLKGSKKNRQSLYYLFWLGRISRIEKIQPRGYFLFSLSVRCQSRNYKLWLRFYSIVSTVTPRLLNGAYYILKRITKTLKVKEKNRRFAFY